MKRRSFLQVLAGIVGYAANPALGEPLRPLDASPHVPEPSARPALYFSNILSIPQLAGGIVVDLAFARDHGLTLHSRVSVNGVRYRIISETIEPHFRTIAFDLIEDKS